MARIGTAPCGQFLVFHGTNAQFDRFSLDFAARPDMHGNGHLGVWLAAERDLAQCYGTHCLSVAIQVDQAYVMPIGELSKLCDQCWRGAPEPQSEVVAREHERQFFTAYRNSLIEQGFDTIYLREVDGAVDMVIGLLPERLTIQ